MPHFAWTPGASENGPGAPSGVADAGGPSTSPDTPSAPPRSVHPEAGSRLSHAARKIIAAAAETPAEDSASPGETHSSVAEAARHLLHIPTLPLLPVVNDASCLRRCLRQLYIVCSGDTSSWAGSTVYLISTIGIFLAISVMIVETLPEYRLRSVRGVSGTPEAIFSVLELIVVAIFIVEFSLRWVSYSSMTPSDLHLLDNADAANDGDGPPVYMEDASPVPWWRYPWRSFTFLFHLTSLIDMASFVPYLVDAAGLVQSGNYTTILRVIRVTRVLQLIKFTSRSAAFRVLLRTLRASVMALVLMTAYVLMGALFFGAILFILESGEWDDAAQIWMRWDITGTHREPSPFQSILHGAYFGIVSMTTVGYGDFYPTTSGGRIVASLMMLAGVMCVAMPVTIISSHFPREYEAFEARRKRRLSVLRTRLSQIAGLKTQSRIDVVDSSRSAGETSPTSVHMQSSSRVLPLSLDTSSGSLRSVLKASVAAVTARSAAVAGSLGTSRSSTSGADAVSSTRSSGTAVAAPPQLELNARLDSQDKSIRELNAHVRELLELVRTLATVPPGTAVAEPPASLGKLVRHRAAAASMTADRQQQDNILLDTD